MLPKLLSKAQGKSSLGFHLNGAKSKMACILHAEAMNGLPHLKATEASHCMGRQANRQASIVVFAM